MKAGSLRARVDTQHAPAAAPSGATERTAQGSWLLREPAASRPLSDAGEEGGTDKGSVGFPAYGAFVHSQVVDADL